MKLSVLIPFISLVLCEAAKSNAPASDSPATSADGTGSLAFAVPSYATSGSSAAVNIIYSIVLLVAIAFMNIPRKSLEQSQYSTTAVLGGYFAVSHILQSLGITFEMHMIAAAVVGVIAAVMSYKKELRDLLFSLISAYGTTYFIVLITRLESLLYASILGVVLFFVYVIYGKMRGDERLLVAMSKADVSSLGFAAFVNVWGVLDLFGGMHGINASEGLFSGFLIGGITILLVFVIVFVMNYFQEWTEEKING
ncbi:hypothetical protein EHEL_060530 [Encephalitozoon hellem ATCC 50504]|uniref:DUF4203 domain-containing protein n=1 Tax=Encephalitozoon hellem TaxID=27973 RepID=A0A9Q9C3A3_ENCHE|nr:uncharacterized protein EHEL_060530 [Encephalitozoon hellem ATCC 50504]AFM98426.1 hypothetical protein EHEL_060530 [Encephalitozoon hellem ATCC 50504]UTX43349.1 hypothetical protein GPU96_06g10960 [Encephalitozoon hellem]|eukprot:XP_003887407.1 hypothetical protein EHEL_060530 [Encephalitozoon hellem ATCC 50504]